MMALTAFLLTFTAQGQTMRSLWIAMPDSLFPYLDRNAKTIMADGVGEGIATGNRLSGQSRIDTLTADYLKATLSEASYIEMKRIANPQGDSILAVVTTFCGPEQESKLDFYDLSWHLLAGDVCAEASTVRPDTMSEDHYIELQQKIEPKYVYIFFLPSIPSCIPPSPYPCYQKPTKAGKGHFAGEKIRFRGFVLKRG